MRLTPAYGRDYKSRAGIIEDLKANKDFLICDMSSPYDGKYVNAEQIDEDVTVRYGKLRKQTVIRRMDFK